MNEDFLDEIREQLLASRAAWERRIGAIRTDRRHENAPLDPDFAEQAVQRENDEPLDALDRRGRQELDAIEAALERIASGSFGQCDSCGEVIAAERLRAYPTSRTCIDCAEDAERPT